MFLSDFQRLSRDNRLLALALMFWGMGEGMFLYIQPLYLKELGADPVTIGNILALAALGAGLAHIPAGYVADHFGRKQVLTASWLLGTMAGIGMFLAPNLAWFVPCLVAYTFTGFVLAALNAYVSAARGEQTMQRALTLVSAGFWTGTLVSPALGGWVSSQFGLRMVFGAASGVFIISTLTMLGLKAQPVMQLAHKESRYGALLRNQRFLVFVGLIVVCMFAIQVGVPFMPSFINEVRGFAPGAVGTLGSFNALGTVFLNLALGPRPPRRGFLVAQGLVLASMLLLLWTGNWWGLALVFFLRAGMQLTHTLGLALVGRVVGTAEMGMAYGITETAFSIAITLGPLAAGWLYQANPALPFQVSIVGIAATMLLFWWLAPKREETE